MAGEEGVEKIMMGDWNTDMQHKEAAVFKSFTRFCDMHSVSQG